MVKTKQDKQKVRVESRARIRQEEIKTDEEGLKKDSLFRETLRNGVNYDTGDPFRTFAYHMVNGSGHQNIVMTTSGGYIFEANQLIVREKYKGEIGFILERFNPNDPNYIHSAPYFTKVARRLSHAIHSSILTGEKITLETNVTSPFEEDVK